MTPETAQLPGSLFLVDASIYIFQAHFSPYTECQDREGNDLSALYGFTRFLLQFLQRTNPQHVAVAMDESLFKGFRHELCSQYKSNRELPDENLEMQLAGCAEVTQALGLSCFGSTRYEADDIIGTLANRARVQTVNSYAVHVVSKDKDLAQLLQGASDTVWDFSSNRKQNRAGFIEEFGFAPERVPDFLGLVGDSVDCIGGVPGVGPVKAKALLSRFGTLEHIYQNLDQVQQLEIRGAARLAAALQEHKEAAYLSKELATIVCDISASNEACARATLDDLHRREHDVKDLQAILQNYRFTEMEAGHLVSLASDLQASRE